MAGHNPYPYMHYPFAVPSVATHHPHLPPAIIAQYSLADTVAAGDQIDVAATIRAERMAGLMANMIGKDPAITPRVCDTARNRAATLRAVQSQFQYGHGPMHEMRAIKENAVALEAKAVNIEIRLSNRDRVAAGQPLTWLRKEALGNGFNLVQIIRNSAAVPHGVNVGNWRIGSRPEEAGLPQWTHYLSDHEIDCFIAFYNETFGIQGTDTTELKNAKLVVWLSQYP